MDDKLTTDQLAEYMAKQIPATFDVFEKNRERDNEYNAASWARGRIDAYLQLMQLIDSERADMLHAEWTRVVSGKGFMSEGDEPN